MVQLETESLTTLHWFGIALAAITGAVHLLLGISFVATPLGWSFLAAGFGFFGAIALVLVDYRRQLVYLVGIPYTAIQIPAWWVVNDVTVADLAEPGIGVFDKVVQLVLIAVLVVLYRREA